ncbi:ATPase [Salipiger sp. P9]|uniref:sensor histidine kinase n=1 Tax=Salipiger pentaromativorans TaxID=2943193 RepID=UPI002157979D|nr:ATP-binding protein [Salipiger pentaromativorans]MCR8549172.1 ATPase [Salipiger pentaromativorans]
MKQAYSHLSPVSVALSVLIAGLVAAALVLWLAHRQPWLGLTLEPGLSDGVTVRAVHPRGSAAGRIAPGTELLALRAGTAPGDTALALSSEDLIEEPDALPGPDIMRAFLRRQAAIHALLQSGPVVATARPPDGGAAVEVTLVPQPSRPLSDLPGAFWLQIGVGLVGMVLGGWVMALRPGDRAVRCFGLAGAGLMTSAYAAALYSTRELALGAVLFPLASKVNFLGTLLFGIGMVNLFLIYPARIAGRVVLWVVAAFLSSFILAVFLDWPDALLDRQLPVALAMLALLGAILVQVVKARGNPTTRAMLGWFGLSVLLGAGGFGLTVTLPLLMGLPPVLSQGHAFLFFLVIFAGLAMGIARYRLFDLADWSFRILFYLGGVVLLLALDAALTLLLALDRAPALGLSLALVGLVYLPLRDLVARWLRNERGLSREELFSLMEEVTLAADAPGRDAALTRLLQRLFDPLRIEQGRPVSGLTRLSQGGEILEMPLPYDLPGVRLHWARQGRRLFSSRDERLARSVTGMLERSVARQRSHDAAIETERQRINRDMHDNIGVQLLGALHSSETERKDMLIRQTLSDLRQIISNPVQGTVGLARLLGDLRREIGDHLEAAGVELDWRDGGLSRAEDGADELPPQLVQTLRALLRESAGNILRHSGAGHAAVTLARVAGPSGEWLEIRIADDGTGHSAAGTGGGNGLANLRFRIEGCGGTLRIASGPDGTRIDAALPLVCDGAGGATAAGGAG